MYPTFETIKEIASEGIYRRIPVCRELYADRYTPVEVMRTLRKASRHCYLLESASQTEVWGCYSFLGYHPTMEITCTDGLLKITQTDGDGKEEVFQKQVNHPGNTLREILQRYKSPVMEEMPPFTGGLVGYFSYDNIKYSEPKLKLEDTEQQDFRDMDLMLFDSVIAFDHYWQKVLLITGVMTDNLENSYRQAERTLKEMAELIRNGEKMEFAPLKIQLLRKDFTVDEYMIYQARVLGASAVLLICGLLNDEQLLTFRTLAESLGMDALVEAHDEMEVERALQTGAKIVGVNNRDLKTFQVDMSNSIRLRKMAPADVVFVSESGIRTAEDIRKACESTADYILLDQGGGGTGKTFDWSLISGIERPFFLAGGLGIHNLSQAICQVHPWAVDLSGSLETDGYKDPEKIRRAVMLVREQTFSGILF